MGAFLRFGPRTHVNGRLNTKKYRGPLFDQVGRCGDSGLPLPDILEQAAAATAYEAAKSFLEESLGYPIAEPPVHGIRVGIPRALTTHSLFPLYSTFFAELGMEVVLSDVDPRGDLRSHSGFCFPAQIAHGAVLDLVRRGVRLVFLPRCKRLQNRTRKVRSPEGDGDARSTHSHIRCLRRSWGQNHISSSKSMPTQPTLVCKRG